MFYSEKKAGESDKERKAVETGDAAKKDKTGFWAKLKGGVSGCARKLVEICGTGIYGYRIFKDGAEVAHGMSESDDFQWDKVGTVLGDVYGTGHFAKMALGKSKKERGFIGTVFNLATTEAVRYGFGIGGSVIEGLKDGCWNGGKERNDPVYTGRETLEGLVDAREGDDGLKFEI